MSPAAVTATPVVLPTIRFGTALGVLALERFGCCTGGDIGSGVQGNIGDIGGPLLFPRRPIVSTRATTAAVASAVSGNTKALTLRAVPPRPSVFASRR